MLPNTCTTKSAFTWAPVALSISLSPSIWHRAAQNASASAGSMHRLSSQPMNTGSAPA